MNPVAQALYNTFTELGYTPVQIAGILGNAQQESGFRPTVVGDNGASYGIFQHQGDRRTNLMNYARDNGLDPADPVTQAKFFHHEMMTSERSAYDMLRNAQNVSDATAAVISFERPQGWSRGNPMGGHGWDNRLNYANQFASQLEGITPQQMNSQTVANSGAMGGISNLNAAAPTPTSMSAPATTNPATAGLEMLMKIIQLGAATQQQRQAIPSPPPIQKSKEPKSIAETSLTPDWYAQRMKKYGRN